MARATIDSIRAALTAGWGLEPDAIVPIDSGMNSRTWRIDVGDVCFVAKLVPAIERDRLACGLAVAEAVEAAGVAAGSPRRTLDGRLVVDVVDGVVALLSYLDGAELTGATPDDQERIGATLGRVHRALLGVVVPDADRFHWVDIDADHLAVEPWVRPAIAGALADYDAIPPASMTWGLLHSDPAPEAFRYDATTGSCGLIDWDRGLVGPLMYDVASAVMYVGGVGRAAGLLEAYVATGAVDRSEIERTLAPMGRMRWAVQADYFARRVARDDRTGLADPAENAAGLDDARRALLG